MLDFDLVGLRACHARIASAKRGETMSDGPFLLDLDRLQLSPYEIERRKVFVDFQRGDLTLQLPFLKVSESMGNHDSKIVDACGVD
jgi:hypothetical protein